MSQERTPTLEIAFNELDANTHHPAMSKTGVQIPVENSEGETELKTITAWRKFLRIVVKNTGTFAAKESKIFARVIIPEKDQAASGSDNFLRYPSDNIKLLYRYENINVGEEAPIPIVIADSDYKDCPIRECPKRVASLATQYALENFARNGLRVEDSFHPGDYLIEVTVTSEATSIKTGVSVHIDADPANTVITKVGPVGEIGLPLDARSRKRSRKRQ